MLNNNMYEPYLNRLESHGILYNHMQSHRQLRKLTKILHKGLKVNINPQKPTGSWIKMAWTFSKMINGVP